MLQKYFILLLSSTLLLACSSGKARMERGQYDLAVYEAVKRLQQNPDHNKASSVLKKSYKLAVNQHFDNIEGIKISNDANKWPMIVNELNRIEQLNLRIKNLPDYQKHVKLHDVREDLATAKSEASAVHYSRGLLLMEKGTKPDARLAYDEFLLAETYKPEDPQILDKLLEAKEAGTVNVVIEYPSQDQNYGVNPQTLYFQIQNYTGDIRYEFLRFISYDNPYYEADEVIQIMMDQLNMGQVFVDRRTEHLIKDDVLIGHTQINDSTTAPVYGKVTAEYRQYTKRLKCNGVLIMNRMDASSGSIISTHRFPATYNWVSEWADFRGDQRALSKEQLRIANAEEPPPPDPQWLFSELSRPMYSAATQQILRFFSDLR